MMWHQELFAFHNERKSRNRLIQTSLAAKFSEGKLLTRTSAGRVTCRNPDRFRLLNYFAIRFGRIAHIIAHMFVLRFLMYCNLRETCRGLTPRALIIGVRFL